MVFYEIHPNYSLVFERPVFKNDDMIAFSLAPTHYSMCSNQQLYKRRGYEPNQNGCERMTVSHFALIPSV